MLGNPITRKDEQQKELIMVRLEHNDPLMLARQLPIKSVALILAGVFVINVFSRTVGH